MSDSKAKIRALVKVFSMLIVLNVVVMSGMTYFTYGIRGNGVLITRTYDLAKFDHVVLVGTGNARITTGQPPFLEITTDENMLPLLEINVSDGKLMIRNPDDLEPTVLLVTIHVPTLRGIELAGNPSIEISDLSVKKFSIGITGHGTANVSGGVDHLAVNISGNGLVQAMDLIAKETEVEIDGAGDVEVHTTMRLAVNCYGSGNVLYAGDPALDGKCEGSVKRVN